MASTLRRLLRPLEVKRDSDDDKVSGYIQRDTRPLPPSRRTYGPWNFVMLWVVTGSFNVGGWTTGSSLISLGLNVWQAMLTVVVAHTFAGLMCVAGGHPGAKWHIGFPFWMRAVWGSYGAYFPMLNRVFLSFIWSATNTWYGGQCLRTLLCCIWPSFANLNGELAGGTMDVSEFVSYFIFLVLCMPLMWISPERYRIPFLIASSCLVPTVFILLIWSMVRAGGGGALIGNASAVAGVESASGSSNRLGWAMMAGITANIGGVATHMFSQSDYTRYARRPCDQLLAQIVMVPLGTIIVSFIGIICTSCAVQMYPQTADTLLWQPYKFLDAVRIYEGNMSARAGVAFASIVFILSQFGMTVASNAVIAGIDLAALIPRYFTIRRGGYVTVILSLIMQPWQLLNSASSFLTVIGGYSAFLGPFMGVMFADYFIIRERRLKLTALYEMSEKSIYWFRGGINWRAVAAWALGTWLLLPGFAEHVRNPDATWLGWTHIYWIAWFAGCSISGALYVLFDLIWPMPAKREVDDEDVFGTFTEIGVVEGVEERSVSSTERQNFAGPEKVAIESKAEPLN